MTQDMKKDTILHKIGQLIVPLKRSMSPLEADSHSACTGHFFNRSLFLLLLILTLGVNVAWGLDSPNGEDRSGYYYIINYTLVGNKTHYNASEPLNGYYLCPAAPPADADANYNYDAVYYDGDSKQKPYLTTYKKERVNDAVWKIEFAGTDENDVDYYYLKHCSSNKYLTHNNPIIASDSHRLSVHLQTEKDGNYSMFCFETGFDDESSFFIRPRQVSSGNRHLNPTHQNCNFSYGTTDGNKKTTIHGQSINLGGMVGYYSKADHSDDKASQWYLEKLPPVISYNSSNLIEISYIDASYTIYYSYGEESTPSSSSENYSETGPFDPPSGTTTIKAVAIKDNIKSDVATFTPTFLLGSTHKYLIQNQNNGWDTGNFQGNHFYMIPGDVDNNGKTKVNTTSMLRPSMQWYILNAGDDYYYIVNNVDNTRMRYNTTNGVHMDAWDEDNANEFKFQIVKSATAGTYNIIPFGVTVSNKYLNKSGSNAGDANILLWSDATQANSRWKFVPQDTPLTDTPPFTPSGTSASVYYKIQNGNGTTFHIIPPATADGNATASEAMDDATVKSRSWYFIQVKDPTTTDWLAYYKIINAGTGKALYYAYTADNSPCLKMSDYDENNNDYKFAFVKSPTADYYYIVPKSHKDDQLNSISTFYRKNSSIFPATTRAASGNVWKFIPTDLFCNDPVFNEENGAISISCIPDITRIYYTTDGTTPDPDDETQRYASTISLSAFDQLRIKAIAVLDDGDVATDPATSNVVTLLNKPDITLAAGPYTYKGTAWEPEITKVSIGTTPNEIVAPTSPATYSVTASSYTNNTNVGTATVTLTDADAGDTWYIWNASTTFTINKAQLTAIADDMVAEYGDAPPTYTVSYTGFVNGETAEVEGVITTAPSLSCEYLQSSGIGNYTIIPSGGEAANYDITAYTNGTLTVGPKEVGLTWSNTSFVYDKEPHIPTATATGLVNDDVCTITAISGEQTNAGNYTATATALSNSNYKLPDPATTTFEITQRPVTVSGIIANDKVYDGTTDATFDCASAAFGNMLEGDALTVTAIGAFADPNAGTDKTVNISGLTLGGGSVANYQLAGEGQQSTTTATITAKTVSTLTIELSGTYTYDGTEHTPEVTVKDGETVIAASEYEVGYSNNVNAGTNTALVTITGKEGGNYVVNGTANFTISPKSIGDGVMASDFTLDFGAGKSIILTDDAIDSETPLVKDTDFEDDVTLSESGRYSVRTVSGINNYTGSFDVMNANVDFTSDANGSEWSATFVAEKTSNTDTSIGHVLPAGVNAYIITGIEGNWAIPEQVDYIPEGVPVLLLANEEKHGFLVEAANSGSDGLTEITNEQKGYNMLEEVTEASVHFGTKEIYLLYNNEFVYNKEGNLAKYKVYLNPNHVVPDPTPDPAPGGARLHIAWHRSTGMMDLQNDGAMGGQNGVWHTIDGRRLSGKPSAKGLYIMDGNKLIVK